ncbi:MAG: transporter substrate-binding domain-containing protein [Desulfobacterales bacterium]|nr:transporter substrate-binding domain-containing protein [Desulfobacterales bacterium]MCP4161786.1 transporter substrate-binding domain-containing protein [Deltaproteobacteria bacterium]
MEIYQKISILILCLFIFYESTHAIDKKVIIATSEYIPYYGEKMKNRGFITEVVIEAFRRGGYKAQIDFYPWKRSLITTKNGNNDAIYTIWKNRERGKWFLFSTPLLANKLVFYKKKNRNIILSGYKDLGNHKIGIVRGYKYPDISNKIETFHKIEAVDDYKNLFNLSRDLIDIIIIDKIQAKYIIKEHSFSNKFIPASPVLETVNQYLAVSKKAENAFLKLNAFNKGLKTMRKDGTFKKIKKLHGF